VQLTDGDWDDDDAAWSPDGTRIAFVSSRAEDRWRFPTPDLYTLSVQHTQAGELQCLTDGSIACSSPSWSPDAKIIAFIGSSKHRSAGHNYLYTSVLMLRAAAPTV
jgi:Tol biopolymer transport system component